MAGNVPLSSQCRSQGEFETRSWETRIMYEPRNAIWTTFSRRSPDLRSWSWTGWGCYLGKMCAGKAGLTFVFPRPIRRESGSYEELLVPSMVLGENLLYFKELSRPGDSLISLAHPVQSLFLSLWNTLKSWWGRGGEEYKRPIFLLPRFSCC